MCRVLRSFTALATAVALVLGSISPPPAAYAQTQPLQGARDPAPAPSPAQCRELNDEDIRAAIGTITEQRLKRELSGLNYAALVQTYWTRTNMDRRIDERVDIAIREVRAGTGWLDRAYSTISREQAEKFAVAVAEKTYDSDSFRAAIADLTTAIGEDIGSRLERAAASASDPAIACMRLALEARYGGAIAQTFEQQSAQTLDAATRTGAAPITTGDLVLESGQSIAGLMLVMTRRMIARMVAQMGRRLAGAIATRIVSSFTGLLGLALIVKDVIEAGEGVFPLVEERMKSDESKKLIKTEIAQAIAGFVGENIETIAEDTASNMFAVWQAFQQRYELLLSLADASSAFSDFLRQREPEELARTGEIVELVVAQEGRSGVLARLENGSLKTALDTLTIDGIEIARQARSLDTGLAWAQLAGARAGEVLRFNVYSRIAPDQITARELDALLSVDDARAIFRLAALPGTARERLLRLPPAQVRGLASRLDEDELLALARYQGELSASAARALLDGVAADPQRMARLARPGLQTAVLASRDEAAAIDMLLNPGGSFSLFGLASSFGKVRDGQVEPRVFVEAYLWTMFVAAAGGLILLLVLFRLIRGRRTTIIVKNSDGQEIGRGKA